MNPKNEYSVLLKYYITLGKLLIILIINNLLKMTKWSEKKSH